MLFAGSLLRYATMPDTLFRHFRCHATLIFCLLFRHAIATFLMPFIFATLTRVTSRRCFRAADDALRIFDSMLQRRVAAASRQTRDIDDIGQSIDNISS